MRRRNVPIGPRRVDPDKYPEDALAILMVSYGITAGTIASEIGSLNEGQVRYRYKKAGVSPLDWRRGNVSNLIAKLKAIDNQISRADKYIESLREQVFSGTKNKSSVNGKKK